MQTAKIEIEAKDDNTVIKKDFKILSSLALYPTTIEKQIIEINIKNSRIINPITKLSTSHKEKSPIISIEKRQQETEHK